MDSIMARMLEGLSSTLAALLNNSTQQTESEAIQADSLDRIADCLTILTIRASVADMGEDDRKMAAQIMDDAMARIFESSAEADEDETD